MKILAMATACLLLATLSSAECLVVSGADPTAPTLQSSSRRIRITALQDGKALGNASMLFYLATDPVNPKLALTTDKQGAVLAPNLASGRYRILAFGPEHESTEVYLEVSDQGGTQTNSLLFSIPPTFQAEKASELDAAPITEHVSEFKGHVTDPSGAFVPGALVQVFRRGSPSAEIRCEDQSRQRRFVCAIAGSGKVRCIHLVSGILQEDRWL
jgi:hypothetical protein